MDQQEQVLPRVSMAESAGQRVSPELRMPPGWPAKQAAGAQAGGNRLRVDARRNLESVLRAAREVFGELGYDAPMEEVARRAGVGVGTVYRRFPSKEVLVRRIAAEEVAWLTGQARQALFGEPDPWEALAGYLSRAVAAGAGRLLPPEAFQYAEEFAATPGPRLTEAEHWPAEPKVAAALPEGEPGRPGSDGDPMVLLLLLEALLDRADAAGALRAGVTVSDVVLVLTAAVPSHQAGLGWPGGEGLPASRLLKILLDGLRSG